MRSFSESLLHVLETAHEVAMFDDPVIASLDRQLCRQQQLLDRQAADARMVNKVVCYG